MGRPRRDAPMIADERQPNTEIRTAAASSRPAAGPSSAVVASSPILADAPICDSGRARK